MDYALTLNFDRENEEKLNRMVQYLVDGGASDTLQLTGLRPHLTLAEFDTSQIGVIARQLELLAQKELCPITVKLASAGFFPNNMTVLYLAPIVDLPLIELHRKVNTLLEPYCEAFSPLYREENWVPHCTMALDLTYNTLPAACLNLADCFEPIEARAEDISLIACCPFCEQQRFYLGAAGAIV